MSYNFNVLEKKAQGLIENGNFRAALRIFLFMADGDNSLDGGYLGNMIGECYEKLGDLTAAKYWYGRAVEENPHVQHYVDAKNRLSEANIDDIIEKSEYTIGLKNC